MSLTANMPVLRAALDRMLTDTGKVERATGETVFNEDTGETVAVVETIYDGPVLVRPQYRQNKEQGGGGTVVIGRYDLTFPANTPVVGGDRVKIAASTLDAKLAGVVFHLLDVPVDTWQVARICVGERAT